MCYIYKKLQLVLHALALLMLLCLGTTALAQGHEAVIRKNLSERIPQIPRIEEITRSPMAGLYEIRLSTNEIYYSDAEGNFLIQGSLIDTKSKRNLTEEREAKLSAIDFAGLPFKDAITIVRGNGKRKLAVFEDPSDLSVTLPKSTTSQFIYSYIPYWVMTRLPNLATYGVPKTLRVLGLR